MSASLVGSEMCIRDRVPNWCRLAPTGAADIRVRSVGPSCQLVLIGATGACLLYTSDAADDM
eukprot:2323162-Alexandrium_andersonii.AAC.1